jgi:hypothetical protein
MPTHLFVIVAAGVRRFLVVLAGLAALTAGGALALTALGGWDANRALSVAFDVVGSFFLVAGFFVGNRGPVRLKGEGEASIPIFGDRKVRWATLNEREEAISDSAVFVAVGFAMIVIGIVIDSRYHLF